MLKWLKNLLKSENEAKVANSLLTELKDKKTLELFHENLRLEIHPKGWILLKQAITSDDLALLLERESNYINKHQLKMVSEEDEIQLA